jgi:hypothetical protein
MRAVQLEGLVLNAIDALRTGTGGEDDRIEFKRDWPETSKARQLAAGANRLNGELLIYVIGVDDRDGSIHPTSNVDAATWWHQFESNFDEVAPELSMHLTVRVTETESVVALAFHTDRAPYLVKVANGGATERDVPIRQGTRTRSARRHELLRLLLPHVQVPRIYPISGMLHLGQPGYYGGDSDRVVQFILQTSVFVEHPIGDPTFLPLHTSRAALILPDEHAFTQIRVARSEDYSPNGVNTRSDGIEVAGHGVVVVMADWKRPREEHDYLISNSTWEVRLEFGVAGSDRRVAAGLTFSGLDRKASMRTTTGDQPPALDTGTWQLSPGSE